MTSPLTGSPAEILLAVQLERDGIPFDREVRFAPPRRWRFDFLVAACIAIEVEGGSYSGGHKRGRAYESDCNKHNAAMAAGYRVYRFTPAMVEDGRALSVIRAALGMEAAG